MPSKSLKLKVAKAKATFEMSNDQKEKKKAADWLREHRLMDDKGAFFLRSSSVRAKPPKNQKAPPAERREVQFEREEACSPVRDASLKKKPVRAATPFHKPRALPLEEDEENDEIEPVDEALAAEEETSEVEETREPNEFGNVDDDDEPESQCFDGRDVVIAILVGLIGLLVEKYVFDKSG
ncbi:expressed unknown protein [Seminavis robusta]|uniref:Uncharacterized protein n=1 Tax=Seminavis robusta TaxID=568900 RepID=A0A9N8EWE2_9STRA|nr:expressed unknown protein [Seminavis robusta]|eukprot:Sro2493_g329250.1 n/a (181) ;mRNA; f:12687-13229